MNSAETQPNDPLIYDDALARKFVLATLFWGVLGMGLGMIAAIMIAAPSIFNGIPELSFGRFKPLHTHAILFAFLGNAVFAAIYYSTPRLCKSPMFSPALGRLHFWSWQFIIAASLVTLPMGLTQGKEYAESEWLIDIAVATSWIGFFATNFFLTLAHRREKRLYISLWFYTASIVVISIVYVVNNLAIPVGTWKSIPLFAGAQDAIIQWWYGHNLISFLMTIPFVGLMYYFVPKAAGRRIYSYRLAIIHFWSLVILSLWAGPHHLHYTAMTDWVTSLGMLFGLMLWMPSWAGVINGLKTIGNQETSDKSVDAVRDPTVTFFVVAIFCYALATLEGPLLSIKSFNAVTHHTDWTIAHAHTAGMGWNGFLIFGMIYWLAPKLFQTPLFSRRLIRAHFWLALVGLVLTVIPLYVAGLRESSMWLKLNENGILEVPDFVDSVIAVKGLWVLRFFGGSTYFLGAAIATYNLLLTWTKRPSSYAASVVPAQTTSAGDTIINDSIDEFPSVLADAPVLGLAQSFDVATRLHWHRRWEAMAPRMVTVMVAGVLVAALIEITPLFMIESNIPRIASVQPYTPLELYGRDLYVSEGCHQCHSQNVRPLVAETRRYGQFSEAGEFVYDRPFQWGSRRVGPDLARQGGMNGSLWHWKHLQNPAETTAGTVMPSFKHLTERPIDYAQIPTRVAITRSLGVAYEEDAGALIDAAKTQAESIAADIVSRGGPIKQGDLMTIDAEAIALIAYLQRLGRDLTTPLPMKEVEETAKTDSGGAEQVTPQTTIDPTNMAQLHNEGP